MVFSKHWMKSKKFLEAINLYKHIKRNKYHLRIHNPEVI